MSRTVTMALRVDVKVSDEIFDKIMREYDKDHDDVDFDLLLTSDEIDHHMKVTNIMGGTAVGAFLDDDYDEWKAEQKRPKYVVIVQEINPTIHAPQVYKVDGKENAAKKLAFKKYVEICDMDCDVIEDMDTDYMTSEYVIKYKDGSGIKITYAEIMEED